MRDGATIGGGAAVVPDGSAGLCAHDGMAVMLSTTAQARLIRDADMGMTVAGSVAIEFDQPLVTDSEVVGDLMENNMFDLVVETVPVAPGSSG